MAHISRSLGISLQHRNWAGWLTEGDSGSTRLAVGVVVDGGLNRLDRLETGQAIKIDACGTGLSNDLAVTGTSIGSGFENLCDGAQDTWCATVASHLVQANVLQGLASTEIDLHTTSRSSGG